MKCLIVSDIDSHTSTLCAEKLIKTNHEIDLIIICGPLCPLNTKHIDNKVHFINNKKELIDYTGLCAATGDVSAIISLFENITCRVVYVPNAYDPFLEGEHQNKPTYALNDPEPYLNTIHMTPNSINIDCNYIPLSCGENCDGDMEQIPLVVAGYSEYPMLYQKQEPNASINEELEEEVENVEGLEISASNSMCHISKLFGEVASAYGPKTTTVSNGDGASAMFNSIFVCNALYISTINQLLFHNLNSFRSIGCRFCIIPSMPPDVCDSINTSIEAKPYSNAHGPKCASLNLPFHQVLDRIHFISPKSLRVTSTYLILELTLKKDIDVDGNNGWDFVRIDEFSIVG